LLPFSGSVLCPYTSDNHERSKATTRCEKHYMPRVTPGQLPNGGRVGANARLKNEPDVSICFDRVGCYPVVLHHENLV
jgi:hypothetical protein